MVPLAHSEHSVNLFNFFYLFIYLLYDSVHLLMLLLGAQHTIQNRAELPTPSPALKAATAAADQAHPQGRHMEALFALPPTLHLQPPVQLTRYGLVN